MGLKRLPAALLALAGTAFADAHIGANGYTIEVTITDTNIFGLVPGGIRADPSWVGTVTEGLFAGGAVTGIDYILIRPDGVMVIDARLSIATPYGLPVAARMKGYWVPTIEMPPLEAFLARDEARWTVRPLTE